MKTIIPILIALLLSSCRTICDGKFPCVQKDSVSVITQIVEKPVILHDTTYVESFYPNPCADLCDSLGRIKKGFSITVKNNKGTHTTIKESDGKLKAETGLNGLNSIASVPQTTITVETTKTALCPLDHPSNWDIFFAMSGRILWVILLIIVAWQVLKRLPV